MADYGREDGFFLNSNLITVRYHWKWTFLMIMRWQSVIISLLTDAVCNTWLDALHVDTLLIVFFYVHSSQYGQDIKLPVLQIMPKL